jgi:hypothetical protein
MNWRLENACSLAVHDSGDAMAAAIKVSLSAEFLHQFCIGLCLLREGLIDAFDLAGRGSPREIRLQTAARATSVQIGKSKVLLSLDTTELERWVHFTLRTVRDGVAEVDHFDLEAIPEGQGTQAVAVVVAFPSSTPPVSPDEARRRLGL